jgi:hypothetical protein
MPRLLLPVLLLASFWVTADSIYRTTDEQGNVIFTDAPPADGRTAEPVGIQRTNTAVPPPAMPTSNQADDQKTGTEAPSHTVKITSPPNETSIPMGPGNFTVTARIQPALQKYESLQLFMDGEPRGASQASMIWDLTHIIRGAHDFTVGIISADGETLAMSPSVRVFVHRPSINFRK